MFVRGPVASGFDADEAKIEILNKDTTRDLHSMQKSEIQWLLA
jgi:hypothetical protein